MAKLWIREYNAAGEAASPDAPARGPIPVAQEPGKDQSVLTFTTSAQSAAFGTRTRFITIIADAAFHYVVGENPTATVSALKVPADTLVSIGVAPTHKIAAIVAA